MSLSPCRRFHPAEVNIRIGQSSVSWISADNAAGAPFRVGRLSRDISGLRNSGQTVIIDGLCATACTIVLGTIRASFGPEWRPERDMRRRCGYALNGATAAELMAWHGWRTIGEAQRYIDEADRIRLAKSAGAKIISRTTSGYPGDLGSQLG